MRISPTGAPTKPGFYRGSGERIFVVPDKSEVRLRYTRLHTASFWLGALLSIACAIGLLAGTRRFSGGGPAGAASVPEHARRAA